MSEPPPGKYEEPLTLDQWQDAVDMAHGAMQFQAAKDYGLVTGGATVNVGLCEEILEKGARRRAGPRPDAVERFLAGDRR